jgi:hypothetical protein
MMHHDTHVRLHFRALPPVTRSGKVAVCSVKCYKFDILGNGNENIDMDAGVDDAGQLQRHLVLFRSRGVPRS